MVESIKERSDKIRAKLEKIRIKYEGKRDVQIAKLRGIQRECKHPNEFETSCMGDRGTHCPDCGKST